MVSDRDFRERPGQVAELIARTLPIHMEFMHSWRAHRITAYSPLFEPMGDEPCAPIRYEVMDLPEGLNGFRLTFKCEQ